MSFCWPDLVFCSLSSFLFISLPCFCVGLGLQSLMLRECGVSCQSPNQTMWSLNGGTLIKEGLAEAVVGSHKRKDGRDEVFYNPAQVFSVAAAKWRMPPSKKSCAYQGQILAVRISSPPPEPPSLLISLPGPAWFRKEKVLSKEA